MVVNPLPYPMPRAKAQVSANVPAFQRKRSLSAKARKRCEPATALARKEAGIPVVKPKKVRRARVYKKRVENDSGLSTFATSSISSDVYERRERLKARLAAERGDSSSGGGLSSLSAMEDQIRGVSSSSSSGGFSSPIIDDYESTSCSSVREMQFCGVVEDFFDKIDVIALRLDSGIKVGDRLVFETQGGLFEQEIESMQIDRVDVMTAYAGDDVGVKVQRKPKKGGNVYKVLT